MAAIKLSDASRSLKVPYQRLYLAVVNGRVPAVRDATGSRWLIPEEALPGIAEALGSQALKAA